MSVIYVMIPIAFLLAASAVAAFIWAARSGQYDEVDSAAVRAVVEDDHDLPAGGDQFVAPARLDCRVSGPAGRAHHEPGRG